MAQAKRKESKLVPIPAVNRPTSEQREIERWSPPKKLGRVGWAVVIGIIFLINMPLVHRALRSAPEAPVALPYIDDFSSPQSIRSNYFSTGGLWRLVNGHLLSPGVRNNPLWLKAKLPPDVAVEFDVRTESPEGDVRVEIFGNGVDHLSGYELIQSGWNNQLTALVRLDGEAGPSYGVVQATRARLQEEGGLARALPLWLKQVMGRDFRGYRVEAGPLPVRPGKTAHWKIERRSSVIRWEIDGRLVIPPFEDPEPLRGSGHDRFGLSSLESDIYYDNLKVYALDRAPAGESGQSAVPATIPPPGPFSDDFNRPSLGDDWLPTDASSVRLVDGAVTIQGAHNHPVWLRKPIPSDAAIEFDCWTDSPEGDIKVEAWGDGLSFHRGPPNGQYTATGYVFVFGGWANTVSAIARQHEHTADRVSRGDVRVQPGRRYHWRIARSGAKIDWSIDGHTFLSMTDPAPLAGSSHQYFAFSGYETRTHFSHLRIQPM